MAGTNLGTAYVKIVPSADGLSGSISKALGNEPQLAGTSLGSKIGTFAKKALASAAVGKVVIDTFKQGAALEQSIGGIQTLYGDAAEQVKKFASQAWLEAGISANTYMEQSTSYAASLISSLGGDQAKAAQYADLAIKDMADNSAKMGTNLEMLQNAYSGFSRGNFTMLDNLKLGFAGSKEGMQSLLDKANEINAKNGETTNYQIDNLADIYEAIHVVQGELGIAGVAADEAASTLSGSFQAMKAAAQDFMGNLIIGENLGPSMANLAESACTFLFDNLVPAIGRVVKGIPSVAVSLLQNVVPEILGKITDLINSFSEGEGLSNGAKKMIKKFATGIVKALPDVIAAIGKLILAIAKAILKLPGKLFDFGVSAVKGLAKGLKSFKIKLPHIYFKSFGKIPWGIGGKGEKPDIGIKWYKTGGIFNSPSVIGVGEAGPEAVVPLNKLKDYTGSIDYEKLGGAIVSALTSLDHTTVISVDGKAIATTTAPYMQTEINKLSNRANRKLGYV